MKRIFTFLVAIMGIILGAQAWVVSGSGAILNGETWNHTSEANTMTKQADGTWQLIVNDAVMEKGVTYEWLVTDGTNWIKNGGANYTLSVTETAKYKITYTLAADANSASVAFEKTGDVGEVTHTYSVAGTPASVFGTEWDQTSMATDMQLGTDGLYWWKANGVTLEENTEVKFKVVLDHAWGEAYPASDYVSIIPEDGIYDITFTFNPTTKDVNCIVEKQGGATIEKVFIVAGSSETLFGAAWDGAAEANKMTKNANNVWEKTYADVTLTTGSIEWKVVKNANTWIPDGNNLMVYVPEDGVYTVVFTYDETKNPEGKLYQNGKEVIVTPKGEGWPANYGGVMLQAFYWDSYEDTQWRKLTEQADTLSKYFDLLWVPNSSNCVAANSMGYLPVYWFDQRSSFGSRVSYLRNMISAYKERGTKIIEDVVLNHKSPVGKDGSYIDFAEETWTWEGTTYDITWTGADICNNDDGGYIKSLGWDVTGANDTGDDFSGARDLDHTSANVQKNCMIYLDFLLKDIGYSGFRLDMVKGYGPQFTKMYNEHSLPEFCVGEYWDGKDAITNWITGTGHTSAAFDFPFKYQMKEAFGNGNWSALNDKGIASDPYWQRYAVTFIDNHDTYENESRQVNGVLGANAFMLAMPGTPCVFLKHWQRYPIAIGNMILARKAAGITNQSTIIEGTTLDGGYVLKVQGEKGTVMCLAGSPYYDTTGFRRIAGGSDFSFYVSDNVTIEGMREGNDSEENKDIIVCVEAAEAPYIYAWTESGAQPCGAWPGTKMSQTITTTDGKTFWKQDFSVIPVSVIFNDGNGVQTSNILGLTHDSYFTFDPTVTDKDKNWTNVTDQYYTPDVKVPACVQPIDGHVYAYFQANKDYDKPYAWVWNDDKNFCANGNWPGDKMKWVGTDASGHQIWLWDGGAIAEGSALPSYILFSNQGEPKTDDFQFQNGGYYDATGLLTFVTTGIQQPTTARVVNMRPVYNLNGQRANGNYRGVVIQQGRKYIVR